jgi:hypothetical protein
MHLVSDLNLCIIFFIRNQQRTNALSSVDIAGSHLKLENREKAIRSFTTLTNTVEMLSDVENTKISLNASRPMLSN